GFAFRHALVRDAAYALLPDDDRVVAHALAGAFLERDAQHEPAVIAQHYERGQVQAEAARWYAEAATRALGHNDLSSALAHARAAKGLREEAVTLARLDLIVADCEFWRGHLDEGRDAALSASTRLPTASADWFHAIGLVITTAGQLGDDKTVSSWLEHAGE